jgi:hypothetical protein
MHHANLASMHSGIPVCSIVFVLLVSSLFAQSVYEPYALTTFAGAARYTSRDGAGTSARFMNLQSLAADQIGNIYAIDSGLRKITPEGAVNKILRNIELNDVAVNARNDIYVSVGASNAIFQVSQAGNLVWQPQLPNSRRIVFDSSNNLYLLTSNAVFKVPPGGAPTNVASTTEIRSLNELNGVLITDIAVDQTGNVYAANLFGSAIYKSDGDGGFKPFAGSETETGNRDGVAGEARLNQPTALATDREGNVYFIDGGYHLVKRISPAGLVTTLPGWIDFLNSPSEPGCVLCNSTGPWSLAVDHVGNIFVGAENTTLLKSRPDGPVSVFAGMAGGPGSADGTAENARFGGYLYRNNTALDLAGLDAVAIDSNGTAYVSDPPNSSVRKITKRAEVTTLARSFPSVPMFATPIALAVDSEPTVFVAHAATVSQITASGELSIIAGRTGEAGNTDGIGEAAGLRYPHGIAVDTLGILYIADFASFTFRKAFPAPFIETSQRAPSLTNGTFRFTASSPPDRPAIVQVSTNLVYWSSIATNSVDAENPFMDDAAAEHSEKRFYRLEFP